MGNHRGLGREEWPTWKHGTWKHDGKKHRGWEYSLEAWDVIMRKENEGSMFEHACRRGTHGMVGLDAKVLKHLIVRYGLGCPRLANACATLRKASAMVREWTGLRFGAMVSVGDRWAKTWSRATGSWRLESRESRASLW